MGVWGGRRKGSSEMVLNQNFLVADYKKDKRDRVVNDNVYVFVPATGWKFIEVANTWAGIGGDLWSVCWQHEEWGGVS